MAVNKTNLTGKRVSWRYEFAIGSRDSRLQYRQGGFATRGEAINAEAAKRLEIERAVKITATGTLRHAIGKFFEDRGPELSPKTLDRYRELAAYMHPDLLALPLADVRAMGLHDEWRRLLAEGGRDRKTKMPRPLSAKTVRNIASVASSALGWAVLYGLIPSNPATASKPPSGPKRKGMALAPSQVHLMVHAAPATWLANFLEIESGLGIRRGEALALRWADLIDGEAHVTRSLCQVRDKLQWKGTKTGEERNVKIPSSTAVAFARHREEQDQLRAAFPNYDVAADLIFAGAFGEPLKPDSVSAKVSRLCKLAKLPKGASLHTLRHSHASQLVEGGANMASVSDRMGHSDPGTTARIYTHAVPGGPDLAEIWERLQGRKPQ